MASKTEICNQALSHLGISKRIANIDTEQSAEARVCRLFWEDTFKATLRDTSWPMATQIEALALVEEDPNDEWSYSYRYPTLCVDFRRVLSGTRADTNDTRTPYKIASDDGGNLIYCDTENADGEYTGYVDNVGMLSSDIVLALGFRLAAYIAPALTGGDPYKLGDRAMRFYGSHIGMAQMNAHNEEQPDPTPDSEFVRARS